LSEWLLEVDLLDNKQFAVELGVDNPNYPTAFMLVKSLLGSRELDDGRWSLSFDDFLILKQKLELSGLVGNSLITDQAYSWLSYVSSLDERNQKIKGGQYNEETKNLLQGKLKNTTPYEDQYPAISFLCQNRRCGDFDEMGVGKSICVLAAASIMEDVSKILVISPYTVLVDFSKEIRKRTYFDPVLVPRGKANALKFVQDVGSKSNWDLMLIHPENLVNSDKRITAPYNELVDVLVSLPWDLIVIDEFHQYKNLSAKRTRCIDQIVREARNTEGKSSRVVLLTGTPVSESPTNAYVALKILNYGKVPHISKFENHFLVKAEKTITRKNPAGYGKGKAITYLDVVGYKNLDELKQRLGRVSIRRSKAEMKGFPDKIFITRSVFLEGKQKDLYKAICGEIAHSLPKESEINIEKFLGNSNAVLRLRQIMNHPSLLGEEGKSAKYEELDNILEELLADPEQKVIIWTEFRAAVDLLFERYNEQYGAVKIYGGVTNEELVKISDAFENKPTPRVAVCIPAKAGTGVDFLARARTAIYVDRPYSLVLFKQSLDRIHRRVNTINPTPLDVIRAKPATIMFLDVVDSIDDLVREKLTSKWDIAEAVTTSDEQLIEMGRGDLLKYLL